MKALIETQYPALNSSKTKIFQDPTKTELVNSSIYMQNSLSVLTEPVFHDVGFRHAVVATRQQVPHSWRYEKIAFCKCN